MAYHTHNRWGHCESDITEAQMKKLLAQLDIEDEEHHSVSLTHESEWCLGAYPGGLVVWENLEQGEPRHIKSVSREHVLKLWLQLAQGNLVALEQEPWRPGYGN